MKLLVPALVVAGSALANADIRAGDIPSMGFGTWLIQNGANATEVVADAIVQGYRHLDCAWAYQNQKAVGAGIKEGLKRTNLTRQDLWVTSKLWNSRHGQEEYALNETLDLLGLDYLDLWLVHWPIGNSTGKNSYDYEQVWKGMEKTVRPTRGTRFIGIANHSPKQLDDLLKIATIKPKAHQFEIHPYLQQSAWIGTNMKHNITVTAYTPLGNTNPAYGTLIKKASPILQHPVMLDIAKARGCTTAQVSLAWNLKRNVVVIPKAANAEHRKENFATVEKCKLTDEDSEKIKNLGVTLRLSTSVCTGAAKEAGLSTFCFEGLAGV